MTAPTNNNFRVKNGLVVGNGSTCNAFQLPTLNGGSGTVITSNGDGTTAWTYSIQGVQGLQGPQGGSGIQGCFGTQGAQGVQGCLGFQGLQGSCGPMGLQGFCGAQGLQGPQGCSIQGLQGLQGPYGVQGVQGTSGGGGGGGGANQALCTTSSVTFNSVNINNVYTNGTLISGITSPGTQVITSYDYTQYSGSKHTVVVTDSNKIHAEDISIVVNGDSYVIESNINTTDGNLGTYSVTTSSNLVTLNFTTTATTNMNISSQNILFPYVYIAPGFSPADLSGLLGWYDTTSASIGSGVWTDKSGNGFNGTIYNASGAINLVSATGSNASRSNPAIHLQETVDNSAYISFPIYNILNGYSDFTIFPVMRWDDSGVHGGRTVTNSNGDNPWIMGFNGFGAGGPAGVYANGGAYGSNLNLGSEWVIGVLQPYFAEWNAYAATIVSPGGGRPGTAGGDVLYIGDGPGNTSPYQVNLYICELIIYNRSLNSTEYGQVVTYLSTKYGIALGA